MRCYEEVGASVLALADLIGDHVQVLHRRLCVQKLCHPWNLRLVGAHLTNQCTDPWWRTSIAWFCQCCRGECIIVQNLQETLWRHPAWSLKHRLVGNYFFPSTNMYSYSKHCIQQKHFCCQGDSVGARFSFVYKYVCSRKQRLQHSNVMAFNLQDNNEAIQQSSSQQTSSLLHQLKLHIKGCVPMQLCTLFLTLYWNISSKCCEGMSTPCNLMQHWTTNMCIHFVLHSNVNAHESKFVLSESCQMGRCGAKRSCNL